MANENRVVNRNLIQHLVTMVAALGVVIASSLVACVGDDPAPSPVSSVEGDSGTSDGPAAAPPRVVSFGALPLTLPFGGGDAKLSFVVEGATSATIDNAVGDVTAKNAADVKVAKTVTYTLTATNAAGTVTATAKVDVEETFTVSGKIVAGGQPVVNVPVVVGNKPATSTSALGTFTVSGVKPPYDVAFALGTPASITVYEGLTRKDPTLVAYGDGGPRPSPPRREVDSYSGTVSGGGVYTTGPLITLSGANRVEVMRSALLNGVYEIGTGSIFQPAHWFGPTTTTATIHATTDVGGSAYYGKVDGIVLSDGNSGGGVNIAMNAVNYVDVACTVNAPAAFAGNLLRIGGGVRFTALGGGYENTIVTAGPLPRIGSTKLHLVTGGSFYVDAAYNPVGAGEQSFARKGAVAATSTTSLDVTLADPARPTAPADTAMNVTAATAFSFGALTGGIHRVTFFATTMPTITVFTKDTTVNLPELTPFGVTLPKDTLYEWRVFGYAPLTSLDDPRLVETLDAPDGTLPPLLDVRVTAATPRAFTTAP